MQLDHDQLRELLTFLGESDIQELRLEGDDFRLVVRRNLPTAAPTAEAAPPLPVVTAAAPTPPVPVAAAVPAPPAVAEAAATGFAGGAAASAAGAVAACALSLLLT
jgi:acetyl-CoA carboxylase biotin carboxyl carrier protein